MLAEIPKTCAAYGCKNTDTNLRMKELNCRIKCPSVPKDVLNFQDSLRKKIKFLGLRFKFLKLHFTILRFTRRCKNSRQLRSRIKCPSVPNVDMRRMS